MSLAVITARGGSKRIPKKNIKEFCGKPIIAYSIIAALESGVFDEVMVSTDSVEIADVAKQYGAAVPFLRSAKNSDDFASTADVLNEVLDVYEEQGKRFEYMACIYPTAPFVTAEKLMNAMNKLKAAHADSLMPVVKYSFPPQRSIIIKEDKICYQYPEYETARSQDLMPIYHDCGQFYVFHTESFRAKGIITDNTVCMVMPQEEVQDIDTMSDWKLAEMKYKTFIKE